MSARDHENPYPAPEYARGVADGLEQRRIRERRRVVEWLHNRADKMNDPHARVVLNLAATDLGKENARQLKAALIPAEDDKAQSGMGG